MYLLFSFTMLMIGGVLAMGIRLELFQPGLQFVNPELFNQLTTMHGIIMIFGAIMPAFVGFANWMVPLQIGAPDMAFARMNNLSFWLLIPAALMLVGSFFMPGGAPAARLDDVPAAVPADGPVDGHAHLLGAPPRRQLDHGLDQHHRHGAEHARTGHDADEDADVLLDVADHRVPADRGDAGARRRDHDDADRPPLRHQPSSIRRAAATR